MTYRCTLKGRGDLAEWRDAARPLLAAGVAPEEVDWVLGEDDGLFGRAEASFPPAAGNMPVAVPPAFIRLAEAVVCHSDASRFSLLYRMLFRLSRCRDLLQMTSDADVVAAQRMAKSVGRDYHKMTAFVRFREVPVPQGAAGRRRFLSWFEPDHFIVARVAPFFQRRFTDMDWMIMTPKGSASWDGEVLRTTDEPADKPDLRDDTEELWRIYYGSIFNPARLKVKMMTTEMPKKYWKNLPEAELIPGLIAGAEAKVIEMAKRQASEPLPFHHRLQEAAANMPEPPKPSAGTLEALREEARVCTRCDLYCRATQTVFGEGPPKADIMFVGEQPGDQEDLAGKPFVGPAGKLFNSVLSDVGIDRHSLYVTNAVKHFKYEPRGKRRIHQKPNMGEVRACRWWLTQEIDLVKPKLVVAMGATALFSLTETRQKLSDLRGQAIEGEGGGRIFVTVHPSYLLRIPDHDRKAAEMERFRGDMKAIAVLSSKIAVS